MVFLAFLPIVPKASTAYGRLSAVMRSKAQMMLVINNLPMTRPARKALVDRTEKTTV
jgi:hypothetical protein